MSWPDDPMPSREIKLVEHVSGGVMLMANNVPLLLMTRTEFADLYFAVEQAKEFY